MIPPTSATAIGMSIVLSFLGVNEGLYTVESTDTRHRPHGFCDLTPDSVAVNQCHSVISVYSTHDCMMLIQIEVGNIASFRVLSSRQPPKKTFADFPVPLWS